MSLTELGTQCPQPYSHLKLFSRCLDIRKDWLNPHLRSCRISVNRYHLQKEKQKKNILFILVFGKAGERRKRILCELTEVLSNTNLGLYFPVLHQYQVKHTLSLTGEIKQKNAKQLVQAYTTDEKYKPNTGLQVCVLFPFYLKRGGGGGEDVQEIKYNVQCFVYTICSPADTSPCRQR